MSSTIPAHLVAICPHCGKRGRAHLRHAGRPTRCRECQRVFRIPSPDEAVAVEDEPPPAPPPEPLVGFDCRVCQTRMSVGVRFVGQKIKCPDCGAATVVPEPEQPRAPDIPSALLGEQYEVYEGEEQPHAADLIAAQTRLIPVECRLCQTLMHAREDQLGEPLSCPDCGVQTIARLPLEESTQQVLVDAYDVAPPEVTNTETDATRAYLAQAEAQVASQAALEMFAPRPVMPRFPLVTGVLRFVRTEGAVARCCVVSACAAVGALLTAIALAAFGIAPAPVGPAFIPAVGAVMFGVSIGIFGVAILAICLGAFAAHMLTIVIESSEGNDQIQEWPTTNPADWFGDSAYLLMATAAAAAPGALIATAAGLPPSAGAGVSLVLGFPVVMLSQLSSSSVMAVFAPQVVRAMLQTFGSWLMFWTESLVLAGAAVALMLVTAWLPLLLLVTVPALVALAAVYFRLVGRLAWIVGERAPLE